jgi:hypothetical protein
MTMRALVQENTAAGLKTPHGTPQAPKWAAKSTLACWAWSQASVHSTSDERTAVVEDIRAFLPLDAALTKDDRIEKIVDRREAAANGSGRVWFPGPYDIDTIQVKPTHLEVMLQGVS